jgi:isoleucyl-tRNA synthetase
MDYKSTLNLPRTEFPMKANLPQKEPERLAWWEQERMYERIQESRQDRHLYILHDGPPYANGHIHIGHGLNKILKDIIIKSKTMEGFRVPYIPGWDCHTGFQEKRLERRGTAKNLQRIRTEICWDSTSRIPAIGNIR